MVIRCPPDIEVASEVFNPKEEMAAIQKSGDSGHSPRGESSRAHLIAKQVEARKQLKGRMTVSDTIRFRRVNGQLESNTNLVEWSDGSVSLVIGEQVFDVADAQTAERTFMFECSDKEHFLAHAPVAARAQLRSVNVGSWRSGAKEKQKTRIATAESARQAQKESIEVREASEVRQEMERVVRSQRGSAARNRQGLTATELENSD
eukprot:GHVN01032717.1.p1 GENE.GHVN01032717.1~~GHVN01032717.1.p1  ORF type:complete len:205 (-),score=47.85 GHVN01032717.1:428-1042(-)